MNEYGSQPNATPQPDPTSPAVPGANFAAPTVGTPQAPASQTPSQGASAPQAMPYDRRRRAEKTSSRNALRAMDFFLLSCMKL